MDLALAEAMIAAEEGTPLVDAPDLGVECSVHGPCIECVTQTPGLIWWRLVTIYKGIVMDGAVYEYLLDPERTFDMDPAAALGDDAHARMGGSGRRAGCAGGVRASGRRASRTVGAARYYAPLVRRIPQGACTTSA